MNKPGRRINPAGGRTKIPPKIPRPSSLNQFGVRAVAEWRRGRVLAHAPSHPLLLRDDHLDRLESLVLVHPVAKRLRGRIPARTPPVSARFHFFHQWRFLTHVRFVHNAVVTPRSQTLNQSFLIRHPDQTHRSEWRHGESLRGVLRYDDKLPTLDAEISAGTRVRRGAPVPVVAKERIAPSEG